MGLIQPRFVPDDRRDGRLIDSVLLAESRLGNASEGIPRTNFSGDAQIQFRLGDSLALGMPPLGSHVRVVVGDGPQEQMLVVDACPDVASVQDVHPFRDWPVGQFVRDPMRESRLAGLSARSEYAVSPVVLGTSPKDAPSLVGRRDEGKETLLQSFSDAEIGARSGAEFPGEMDERRSADGEHASALLASPIGHGALDLAILGHAPGCNAFALI